MAGAPRLASLSEIPLQFAVDPTPPKPKAKWWSDPVVLAACIVAIGVFGFCVWLLAH